MPLTRGRRPVATSSRFARQLPPVIDCDDEILAISSRSDRVRGQRELDPLAAQDLTECFTERRRLPREYTLGHLDDRHLAAKPVYRLGHLHPDRPTAQNEKAAGNGLHRRCLAIAPDAVEFAQARDGRDDRIGAIGQDDVVGRVAHAVDLDDARAGEPAGAAQKADAAIVQPVLLSGIGVVRHHEITIGKRRLDIDLRGCGRLAGSMNCLARAQQRLGWNACPVRAFPSHELALDDGDAQAALGQSARAVLARRTPAKHDYVVLATHEGSSSPARSRTM